LVPNVQASSGVHPSSSSVGAGGFLLWVKADHSHPCRAEVENKWSYMSTPPYACMVSLYFTLLLPNLIIHYWIIWCIE
jgi:hypothetical protein